MEDSEVNLERFIGDHISPQVLSRPLSDTVAWEIIDRLKQEADRHWSTDAERSLEFANRIIAIGNARNDMAQAALGWMARGDALRFSGQMEESWNTLEQAGKMFETAGDEVGWARTRVGCLYLAVKLNHVKETLTDGKRAQKIFKQHNERELLVRLNMARAVVYGSLGNLHRALRLFNTALVIANALGKIGQQHLGLLYMNIGVTYEGLGDFSQAIVYYERARSAFNARNEARNIALVELNIAYIAQAQGHYRDSLRLLHNILERDTDPFPLERLAVKRDMTECYLHLNRYFEARDMAREVVSGYRTHSAAYEMARGLLHLATAEAELGNFRSAHAALEESEHIFVALGATSWHATIHLRRGRIALNQGNLTGAYQEAFAAASNYEMEGQQVNYAKALLLQGQASFARGDFDTAIRAGIKTLNIAQHHNVPSLLYTGHLLLGKIAEAQHKTMRARRRYQVAAATIERVQRGLTITLRPGFLEDKGDASRALISLYLGTGNAEKAFETVEDSKSQVLLGYLLNRDFLHWSKDDTQTRSLIDELNKLRSEHQWFYHLAHASLVRDEHPNSISPEQALVEVANRERRMRAITERLYLNNHGQQLNPVPKTCVHDIQCKMEQDSLLIELYNDGVNIWAFVLDQTTIAVRCLPIKTEALRNLIDQLQTNIRTALNMASNAQAERNLTQLAQRILQRLNSLLIEPILLNSHNPKRLVIVPYGSLHSLPFHLLYDGSKYLIEKHEVVILPAASLATRTVPQRKPGALILAHSYENRLPYTVTEAQAVQKLFGGELYTDERTNRKVLEAPPTQILHIAAHGQHRLDQPDLSYLLLGDGQLYADDLLQQDLSYELITLSGCETGRAIVAANDELIGLGRGFLYAGAGALIVSQWRVPDDSTLHFMKQMYAALYNGRKSKAAALREAQCSLIAEHEQTHPAFWGAFQLIGNADPLST